MRNLKATLSAILMMVAIFSLNTNLEAQHIRGKHESMVLKYAKAISKSIMESICPMSGHDSKVVVYEWIYDEYLDSYEFDMTAYWKGIPSFNPLAEPENFSYRISVSINSARELEDFTPTHANGAVYKAMGNSLLLEGGIKLLESLD